MSEKMPSRPTWDIREALNDLLRRNKRTQGKEVGEMYLGSEIFIAQLRRPQVVEGKWEDIDKTIDLFDLIDAYQRGDVSYQANGKSPGGELPKRPDSD